MAQRRCPECGQIENEFTYFCTECGARTVEFNGTSSGQSQKPVMQPIQSLNKVATNDNPKLEPHKSEVSVHHEDPENKEVINNGLNEDVSSSMSSEQPELELQPQSEPLFTTPGVTRQEDNAKTIKNKRTSQKINPIMIGMAAVIVVLIIVVVALLANRNNKDEAVASVSNSEENLTTEPSTTNREDDARDIQNKSDQSEVNNSANEIVPRQEEMQETSYKDDSEASETSYEEDVDMNEEFGISSNTREDYSQNLNPNYYRYYNSGITDFDFWYPADMFYSAFKDTSSFMDTYGENIETITFDGSGGSKYVFSLTRRTDNMSTEDMMEYVHQRESSSLYGASDILVGMKEDYGKVIVTGWLTSSEDYSVYDLTKVERDYVIRMYIILPNYTSEEDRLEKAYVVENVYRLCDYADSTRSPRSYEEFLEDN